MTYIVAISAYLVLLTIFGLIVARKKVKTSDDMVTGGHRIPFIILVGTLLATWCGGITGSASVVYTGGPWVGLITFAAPPIGIILLYFIAGKVRKSNKVTVPEIMGARYGKAASIIAALCVMLAYVGVLATQLKADSTSYVVAGSTAEVDNASREGAQALSLARARAVRDVLVVVGIPADQITCLGLGNEPTSVRSANEAENRCVYVVSSDSVQATEFRSVGQAES